MIQTNNRTYTAVVIALIFMQFWYSMDDGIPISAPSRTSHRVPDRLPSFSIELAVKVIRVNQRSFFKQTRLKERSLSAQIRTQTQPD